MRVDNNGTGCLQSIRGGLRPLKLFLGILLALAVAIPSFSQRVKNGQDELDFLSFSKPEARVVAQNVPIESLRQELSAAESQSIAPMLADWDRFLTEREGRWVMIFDRLSGRPASMEGRGIPWIPGTANSLSGREIGLPESAQGMDVPVSVVAGLASDFLKMYPDLLGASPEDLRPIPEASGPVLDYLYFLDLQWTYHGIPVDQAHVVFRLNHGNLVQVGQEKISPQAIQALDPTPTISLETAWQMLWGYLGTPEPKDEVIEPGRLLVLPMSTPQAITGERVPPGAGLEYRLVYEVAFRRAGTTGTWQARIDAHSGEVVQFLDANRYGSIHGGTYPGDRPTPESDRSFPYADTGLTAPNNYADSAGVFPGSGATSTLNGKYVRIQDKCGSISLSTTSGDLGFGSSSGTDCTTPGIGGAGNTHAARTQYYNVTLIKIKALTYLPSNTWLQGQILDKTNLTSADSSYCPGNAWWDGTNVNFCVGSSSYGNTGELPGVSLHEWAHGLDSNDGSPSGDKGTGETYGDFSGVLQTHGSCVGNGFFLSGANCSGYGDPCVSCSGIRQIDWNMHSAHSPHFPEDLTSNTCTGCTTYACSNSATYPGPCGKEGHCESLVSSEAMWDLPARDLTAWGLDSVTAWQLMDRFWYASRTTSGQAYDCPSVTTANGCGTSNYFTTFRVVDDCDGDLSNGTPHASAIFNAFNRHKIACSSVVNTDQTSCCPTLTSPALSGVASSGQASLSWSSVSNATKYYVYRNESGCDAGFTKVGTVTTPSTSFLDTPLTNGLTYYYRVQAIGSSDACTSPMSNCVTLTPLPCTTPGAPTMGTVTVPGNNQLTVSWSAGSPAGATYNVYRSTGACPGGAFTQVSTGQSSSLWTDTTVSGGTTYSYKVTAVDITGGCESAISGCASATATGTCTAPPTFAGITSVTSPANTTCTLSLGWAAGTSNCSSSASYRVYRSTTAPFTPAAGNRIASGIAATSYSDSTNLTGGTTYHYIVRAVDGLNGVEEENAVTMSGTPVGPGSSTQTLFSQDFETGSGTNGWRIGTFNSGATTDWRGIQTCAAHGGTKIYRFGGSANCTANYANSDYCFASPGGATGIAVPAGANTVRLTFWHKWQFEDTYDGALLYISTDGTNYSYVPASAFISGAYNSVIGSTAAWSGTSAGYSSTFSQVVLDLDAAANAIAGNTGGAGGKTLWIAFTGYSDTSLTYDGWFLDDVSITANIPGTCTTCVLTPNFVAADPTPATPNTAAGQTLVLSNPAGSGTPSSFSFLWDASFTVNPFTADPDGILGFWQSMAPYSAPFSPTASFQIIRRDATNAFVDVNGDGTYLAGTDYDVALSDHTITISRPGVSGTESQATGYRLILQNSLFVNPDSGNYPIQAALTSSCGSWSNSISVLMDAPGAGCTPTVAVADTLMVTKSGSEITLSWNAPGADGCRIGYAVLASSNPAPTATWTDITGQNLLMDSTATTYKVGLGLNLTYYLVAGMGESGQIGPTGQ